MDKYTFGNSRAAVNLMASILEKPEYKHCSAQVARILDKHFKVLGVVAKLPDKTIRGATLQMWHKHFLGRIEDLPELVRTHTACVMASRYHQLLGDKMVK